MGIRIEEVGNHIYSLDRIRSEDEFDVVNNVFVVYRCDLTDTVHTIWGKREYLLKYGQPTNLSGGFEFHAQRGKCEMYWENGYIKVGTYDSDSRGRLDCLNKEIDYSKYNKLCMDIGLGWGNNPQDNYIDIALSGEYVNPDIWIPDTNPAFNITNMNVLVKSRDVYTFDISNVNKIGMFMLGFRYVSPWYCIYNIWFE